MKALFVWLLAVLTVVTASPTTTTKAPSTNNSCISGCTCRLLRADSNAGKALLISKCTLDIAKTNFKNFDPDIVTLKFDNVIITSIEQDALSAFENLGNIIIENAGVMTQIAPTAFDLPNIDVLKFSSTNFKVLPKIVSDNLDTLIFVDCQLTQIPDLDDLPSLSILKLDNNSISEIPSGAFAKAHSLEEVTLTNNSLSQLSLKVFFNNTDLTTLQLDNNPLKSLEFDFDIELQYLSVRSCMLTSFDTKQNLKLVNHLDLSDNQIAILHLDAFEGMTDLNYVDLSRNGLIELDDNIFEDSSNIQKMILDGNKFNKLPKFQTVEKNFQKLYFSCSNCSLKSVDGAFDNMPGIETINLANNKISNVDGVFDASKSLKKLDLSNNKLTSIRYAAFSKNVALADLNLSGNLLEPLDPLVLTNLELLTTLDMSNAGLTRLWDNHNAALKSVQRLLVGKNPIKTITLQDLEVTPQIKLLDIEWYNVDCGRELKISVLWLMRKEVQPIQGAWKLKTHDDLRYSSVVLLDAFNSKNWWKTLFAETCPDTNIDVLLDDYLTDDKNSIEMDVFAMPVVPTEPTDADDYDYDDRFFDDDQYEADDYDRQEDDKLLNGEIDEDVLMGERIEGEVVDRDSNLTRASYILSITSVFIVTALAVLTVAVTMILLIMKRNGVFNVQNVNMPRFKLPIWQTVHTQKKHSGSVYKPLSEEKLPGPKTPMINRYEFNSPPQVHNSIP